MYGRAAFFWSIFAGEVVAVAIESERAAATRTTPPSAIFLSMGTSNNLSAVVECDVDDGPTDVRVCQPDNSNQ